jgi:excisionase family DNA binding protein
MDELLTTRQLEDMLHVDRITVYRMLDRGLIPGFKVGGQWRFSRSEISAWLSEQRGAQTAGVAPVQGAEPEVGGELPLHCFEAIQGIAAEAAQVCAVTVGIEGEPLVEPSAVCESIAILLEDAAGRSEYVSRWNEVARDPDPSPRLRKGADGLWCVGAPISVGGSRVGAFVLGPFALAPDAERASDRAEPGPMKGSAQRTVQQAARIQVRSVDAIEAQRLQRLAARVAGALSQIGQERMELMGRLKRIAEITALNP